MSDTRVPIESLRRKKNYRKAIFILSASTVVLTVAVVVLLKNNKSFDVDYKLLFEKYANLQDDHAVLIDNYLMVSDRALKQYETLNKIPSSTFDQIFGPSAASAPVPA